MGLLWWRDKRKVEDDEELSELRSAVMDLREVGKDMRSTQERLESVVSRLEQESNA